jgi:predicted GH43/DUF377 family glycosyl hydrolase
MNPTSLQDLVIHGNLLKLKLRTQFDRRWLVITHGVGAMRRYCIGASLFDLDDPSKEIGRLKELLSPREDEREGYVNVVYSCGAIIHNNSNLPYAVSDYSLLMGWIC